jgi:hypothetical protein
MAQSLIGVFHNLEDAVEARQRLREQGFADSAIRLHRDPATLSSDGPQSGQDAGSWLRSLFSVDEDYVGMYSEAVRRGHHLLTVDAATDQELEAAHRVLEQTRSIDIEQSSETWRKEGWKPQGSPAPRAATAPRPAGRNRAFDRLG